MSPRSLVAVVGLAVGCGGSPRMDVFELLQANAWYLPTADGKARLYVTEIGRGPTVVVFHGGPGNDFQYLLGALRPHTGDFRFVLFDQRGSLLSPMAPAEVQRLSLADLVDDVEALRQALSEERLVIFGHSWGTYLATAYYRAHPQRVAGLVLAASAPPVSRLGATFMDEVAAAHERIRALRARPAVAAQSEAAGVKGDRTRLSPQAKWTAFRIDFAGFNLWHAERWRELHGAGVYYNQAVDDAVGRSLPATYDTLATLRAHPVPVTVVQGDHDYLDPAAASWRAASPRPDALEVEVLAGAGHYSWIDEPDGFARALGRGLRRASNTRGREPGRRAEQVGRRGRLNGVSRAGTRR
jgi:proline iminopeptidase